MRHQRTTCGERSRTIRPVLSLAAPSMNWMLLVALCGMALAMPFPAMAQTTLKDAGTISARIPVANILHGKQTTAAEKDAKVQWGDKIKTEIGGRARVRLLDGSILNVGSQALLTIESHDPQSQRTSLQLAFGRMRASVVRITNPAAGGFEVRSSAAVAGVVGTDVFTDASEILTTVIALGGGQVTVGSPNPLYASFRSLLNPGEAITLIADQRPGEKRLATDAELGGAIEETEVNEIVRLEPRVTFPGHTMQARIVGKGLGAATSIAFAREGISIQATGPAVANGLPVSITVAQDVPHGTYPFTVQRPDGPQVGVLIVTSEENSRKPGGLGGGGMEPPAEQTITATRGAKFALDASATKTPAGTSISAFLWSILETRFSSNTEKFTINTSLLKPGEYIIQLVVINDRGQVATQRYPLTVELGMQPAEIIRELASGYESLQPNQFLKYFDEEKFRNYAGFASAIEDSFRNQIETVRVFQRPVNCTISEEQDQAACQADFELQFTKKDQPTELLDPSGNPFPPGVAAPAGSAFGKRLLTGTERTTIRFERADKGWRIVDYAAQVSCPGGSQVSGLNVGSCILAIGSFSSPGVQFTNVLLPGGSTVPVGGTLTGTFDIAPLGGFNGTLDLVGVADVGGTPATLTFSPNPAPSLGTVTFTVVVPPTAPSTTTSFNLTITGTDTSGAISQTISIPLLYQGAPPFSLQQFTNPSAPLTLLANSSVVIGITAACGASPSACASLPPVTITFGPLPAGVTISPSTANVLPGSTQPFTFTFTPSGNQFANFGVANITVTGTAAGVPVQTSTIVLNLGTAGSLPFSLFSSPPSSIVTLTSSSIFNTSFNVFVSSQQAFNQPINISVGTPPPGVTISPNTFVFTPGLSGSNVFYSVAVDPAVAVPGSYPILISGVSGGVSATTTWTLDIRGAFSISVTPQNTQITPLVLPPDGVTQTTVTVTVTSINGFAGSVTVFLSNPFGAGVTVTPGASPSINVPAGGSASAVFTFVAAVGVANTFTNATVSNAVSFTGSCANCTVPGPFMTIGPAGFTLSSLSSLPNVNINSGSSVTVGTQVQPLGSFGASVDFTVVSTSVPAGVTVSPSTQRVAAGGTASFTVRANTPAVVGNFPITVNAVSGSTTIPYTINARLHGQITLSVTQAVSGGPPGTQTVPLVLPPGGQLSFTVSVGGIDGFSGSVTAQAFNMPAGVTAIFPLTGTSSINMSAPSSDTLTLANVSATPVPLASVFVQAFDPSNSFTYGAGSFPSQQIYVTTGSPSFVLGCSSFFGSNARLCNQTNYLSMNINQAGSTSQLDLQVDSVGGYSGTVSVTPVNMPAGVTMSPNPVILSPGRPTTVTFSATSPAVAGRFSGFTLVGNDTVTPTTASSTPVDGQLNGSLKIVVTPATTQNVPAILSPGVPQVFSVDIFGMNGFSGTANLDFSLSLFTGITTTPPCCSMQVNVPTSGSITATVTLNAAAGTPSSFARSISWSADGFDANFNGITYFVNGETDAQSLYVVGPSTFNVSVTNPNTGQPPTLSNPQFVQVGQPTSLNVSISAIGAFTGTVFLDVTGLPSCISVSSAPGTSATIPVHAGAGSVVIQPQIAGVNVPGTSVGATLYFNACSTAPRGYVQGTLTATFGALVQSIPLVFFITPQVTLSLTPAASTTAPMVIAPGSSGTLQIAANASPTFAGDVDLSFSPPTCSSLPAGVTINPVSARVTLGGFTTVTVNLASTVTAGSKLSLNICASINGSPVTQSTATIIAGSGAFSLGILGGVGASSTSPLIINAGSSGAVGVAITAFGSFSGSVTVSASFTVTSLSTTPSSVTIVHPGGNGVTATTGFTVDAAAGAQGLIGRMFINASGGGQSVSTIVFISIGSGGFSLSVSGNSSTNPIITNLGGPTSFQVLVHQQAGFTGTVSLSAGGLPAGVSIGNNNFLVPAGTVQQFDLSIAPSATAGDTQLTITGTSGGAPTVNLTVFLRIRGQFNISIIGGASSSNPLVVAPGGSQTVDVQVVPVASFLGSVQISLSTFGLPSGVSVSPLSATATPGTPATFTVSVAAGTGASPVSTFTVFASGTYGASFPQAQVYVSVATNPTFNMSFGTAMSVDIGDQFGSGLNVALSAVGGFSGSVTLTVNTSQLPSGVTVSPASSTFPLSGAASCFGQNSGVLCMNLTFVATSAVVSAGSFNVDITATSGAISITQTLQLDLLAFFNITLSAGASSNNPIVLQPTGSQNFNLILTTTPPNVQCNGSPFSVDLALISTPPTGVTANITPTATVQTPGVTTVTTSAAPATGVFGITGTASAPSGCSQSGGSGTAFFVIGPPSFSLSVPSSQTGVDINRNTLSNIFISVNSIGTFQGTVTVSVVAASVPAGITVTPANATVAAGNSFLFQVRADSPAVAGNFSFNITATDGTTTLNGTIPLLLRGTYTLTISPANSSLQPAVVTPGQSVNYTVTVTPQNGFSGTVSIFQLCCSQPPTGVTVTGNLSATSASPGQISVSASATAVASQPQPVFFFSTSTQAWSNPTFLLYSAVGPASFRVTNSTSVSFPQQLVINGTLQSRSVTVQSLGGFSGTVNLVLGSLPAGLTASPQTALVTVPAGGSASLPFSFLAGSQVAQGPFDIQLTASQGTTSVNTFFYLYAASNMALVHCAAPGNPCVSPPSTSSTPFRLLNGDLTGQTVSVEVLNQGGFTGSIALAATSVPAGMTVTPLSTTVAANGSANFQITAQTASVGLQFVNINASFSGLSAQTTVWLNVGVGSYLMSTTPVSSAGAPISLDPNGTMVLPIGVSIIPQNGFVGTVDITPTGLPAGVTVTPTTAQVVISSAATGTTTFNFSATVAQGLTPISVTYNATAAVSTPVGPVNVNNSDVSFLLVNPPTFALTQIGGTVAAPISIEQGIPPGGTFQIGITGTGTVNITFANVPTGVTISPPTANITAGSSGTFSVVAAPGTGLGNYTISVVGSSAGQLISLNLFVNVVTPTNGFFLSTTPPTSLAAPVILQPDHTLVTFLDINVQAKGTFAGMVTLSLTGVPTGVTATLTPSTADLSLSPSQVVQLQFQTSTGLAPFGPSIVSVDGVSGTFTASTPVFAALQIVSAIQQPGSSAAVGRAPEILQVLPPGGYAGSHMVLTLQGSGLSTITQVMSSTTKISAQLEPGGTDSMRRVGLFARPDAAQGTYTLMLVSPRGTVTMGFQIVNETVVDLPDGPGRGGRPTNRSDRVGNRLPNGMLSSRAKESDDGSGGSQPIVTRVEPATLKPGEVVVGKLYGENLQNVRGVRAFGLGISIEVLEAHATELKVRFNVAAATASGSRMISLTPGGLNSEAMLSIQDERVAAPTAAPAAAATAQTAGVSAPTDSPDISDTPARRGTRTNGTAAGVAASSSTAPADLVIRSSDISMSPGSPRPGDNVTFRVQLSNRGGQNADDVEVEFTLGGANVRVRERFSVAAGSSQSFQVEWQAVGSGRFEPRVVIDPERRLNLSNRASTQAAMPAFEMLSAAGPAGRGATAFRDRGQLTLSANGCQGFRFSSGTEQSCNGGADFEVRLAPQGGALRIEADGVRNVGAMAFDQASQVSRGAMGTSETVLPGAVYLVETRRGTVLVRVMDIRGLNSVRAAAPTAMNRPRLSDVDGPQTPAPQNNITLVLEWRALSQ